MACQGSDMEPAESVAKFDVLEQSLSQDVALTSITS
jgi:hypothetical protein